MSGVPPKHPKKKRCLDASQEPLPGPSSGRVAQPKRRLKQVKKSLYPCTCTKSSLPSSAFVNASEILKAAPSRSASSCSLSSEKEAEQVQRSFKYRYREMPIASSLRKNVLESFGSIQSHRYIRTAETIRRLQDPIIPSSTSSSTEDEDENVQAARTFKYPHEEMHPAAGPKNLLSNPQSPGFIKAPETSKIAATSFLLKIEEGPVRGECSGSNENELSGSKPISEVNNHKKGKCRVHNKRKKTNSKYMYSDREAALEAVQEGKRDLNQFRKNHNVGPPKKPKVCKSSGWDKKDEDFLETITDNEQFFKQYQDCYGLVENVMKKDTGVDYFSNLPTHIIELILCTVPMIEFMKCRRVCRRWLAIIDNSNYMTWKKMYYKCKKDHNDIECYQAKVKALTVSLNHQAVDGCIATIVNYMGKEFNRVHSRDMYDCLLQNPHGELADHVLKERFPEWNGKDSRVWCQLAVAVLICESVWDILKLYQTLLTVKSYCLRTDIHDAFYCFALFLYYFRCMENINAGLHYRVYYALYVIENSVPFCQREKVKRNKDVPEQQSIQNYRESNKCTLTHEQIRILNHCFNVKQRIKIIALAGTGKTTTLVHLARLYPQIKFLNLVFNNIPESSCNLFDLEETANHEAKKRFPSNVVCKTAHGVAYEAVGKELQHKLTAVIRPYDLIGHIKCNLDNLQIYLYGKLVLTTISHFMYSKEKFIGLEHVPCNDSNERLISHINRERVLMDACAVWEKMGDSTSDVRITHDVYLKLYQLKKPTLHQFDCIMVDDAQDCNPAIMDIVLSQRIPVILVGDPHQQIYSFRASKNALQLIRATHTYSLTKSFRFGPEISYIASCVLEVSLNTREDVLVGNTTDSNLRGETSGQFAVISRTNTVLFNEAVRMIVLKRLKPYEPQTIQPYFAGGISSYGFDKLLDIYMLKFPKGERNLKDKFISQFKTLHDLYKYAEFTNDTDIMAKIDLVNQHGHEIPNYLVLFKQRCSPVMKSATVVFSTAYKSKGLEFDTVSLTDDYVISPITGEQSREEANILYIAITRAKKCLLLPEKMTKLLHAAHEKFECPVSSKSLLKDREELKCVQCNSVFVPHTILVLVRRRILMASGREVNEGPLCMKCRSEPTMRPDLHLNGLIMYLDPIPDNSHRVMGAVVGPLPSDPPIVHDRFNEYAHADRVFVINLNIH